MDLPVESPGSYPLHHVVPIEVQISQNIFFSHILYNTCCIPCSFVLLFFIFTLFLYLFSFIFMTNKDIVMIKLRPYENECSKIVITTHDSCPVPSSRKFDERSQRSLSPSGMLLHRPVGARLCANVLKSKRSPAEKSGLLVNVSPCRTGRHRYVPSTCLTQELSMCAPRTRMLSKPRLIFLFPLPEAIWYLY